MKSTIALLFLCSTIFHSLLLHSTAADWPQYRGPTHDGVSTESIQTDWAVAPPRLLWKIPLGPAFSSFAVANGKAFTQVRRTSGPDEREFCIALDAASGAELWSRDIGPADYPNEGAGSDDGPRSTPSVDGDRVFVLSSYLRLISLDAQSGDEIWARDLVAELGSTVIDWQNAASPLIIGDFIYLNGNASEQRLLAIHKSDGTIAWNRHDDAMTHATPVHATIAGVPQIVFFAQSGLVSVAPSDGAVLWRYPFRYTTTTAASPVIAGDVVHCSAAFANGGAAVRISKTESGTLNADQIWRKRGDYGALWATPIYFEGHLYGIYGHSTPTLRCFELATGAEKWKQDGVGFGSVLRISNHLLILTEDGILILAKPDPGAYSEVARFEAVKGKCWNAAAVSHGRIYLRSTTEAAAYDVNLMSQPQPVPPVRLQIAASKSLNTVRLVVGTDDGSPLDSNRASGIQLFATSDPALSETSWERLDVAPVLVDGQLQVELPVAETPRQQFFRSQEDQ